MHICSKSRTSLVIVCVVVKVPDFSKDNIFSTPKAKYFHVASIAIPRLVYT